MPLSPLCSSILSGSYDNTTRLWSTKGEALMTIPGHSAPVKCVGWIKHGKCSLRPRKPEGSLGQTAQDVHLDSHTAPELSSFLIDD